MKKEDNKQQNNAWTKNKTPKAAHKAKKIIELDACWDTNLPKT
jgi:hypothetical protein